MIAPGSTAWPAPSRRARSPSSPTTRWSWSTPGRRPARGGGSRAGLMRIVPAAEAIAALPAFGRVFVGPGCGLPVALCDALGEAADRFRGLHVYCGLIFETVRFLEADPERVRLVSLHPTAPVEPLVTRGDADYLPVRYSRIPAAFAPGGPLAVDAALV